MRCWFFRLMISIAADSDGCVGRATSRHMSRCADCRQFHQQCRLIGRRLRSEAGGWQRASGRASRGVLARLDGGPPPAAQDVRVRGIRVGLAVAACIAIAAAATMFLTRRPTESPAPPFVAAGPAIPVGMNPPTAWIGLVERPLTTEVRSLTRDTESGIRFLVACLRVGPPADQAAHSDEPVLLQ
jgi:hypothetical protein